MHARSLVAAATERDLKDKAHRHLMKGQLEPALEVLRELICMNGREAAYRLRHAEVSARLKRLDAAIVSYRVAARLLADAGRVAQAKAVLHTAMQLAPKDLSLRRAVKELLDAQSPAPPPPPVQALKDIRAPKLPRSHSMPLGVDDAVTEPCLRPVFE